MNVTSGLHLGVEHQSPALRARLLYALREHFQGCERAQSKDETTTANGEWDEIDSVRNRIGYFATSCMVGRHSAITIRCTKRVHTRSQSRAEVLTT